MSDALKVVREALEEARRAMTNHYYNEPRIGMESPHAAVVAALSAIATIESQVRAEAMEEAAKVADAEAARQAVEAEHFERLFQRHTGQQIRGRARSANAIAAAIRARARAAKEER